jgi:hypothetical protein
MACHNLLAQLHPSQAAKMPTYTPVGLATQTGVGLAQNPSYAQTWRDFSSTHASVSQYKWVAERCTIQQVQMCCDQDLKHHYCSDAQLGMLLNNLYLIMMYCRDMFAVGEIKDTPWISEYTLQLSSPEVCCEGP